MSNKLRRFHNGKSYFYENNEYGEEYCFTALEKYWSIDFDNHGVEIYETPPLKFTKKGIRSLCEVKINVNSIICNIINKKYMARIIYGYMECNFFAHDKFIFKKFYFDDDEEEKRSLDLKELMTHIIIYTKEDKDIIIAYEKTTLDCDESIKSNLIKRYYKNALVNHNTKFGMNKMFDSFVF